MNFQKIALLLLLAAWARPVYSGAATAGEATSTSTSLPAGHAARSSGFSSSAAVATEPPGAGAFTRGGRRFSVGSFRAAPVLVVPAQEMDTATYGRIVEDLSIMNRIIEKSLANVLDDTYAFPTTGSRILMLLPSDTPGPAILRSSGIRPKAIYVGGYGAVFSLQVDFPLVPPPQAPEANKTPEKGDQVWAAAQRELTNPPAAPVARPGGVPGRPYRAEAVEALRSTLLASLQHAANIRDLQPESWLTILVQGPGLAPDQAEEAPGNPGVSVIWGGRPAGTSLLTLRAKKADIDQFAHGQLDQTQFQQHVQIVAR